jgi:uncharacterized membrane protein
MSVMMLFTIMSLVGFTSLYLEKNLTWMAHVSGVCLVIIVALLLSNLGVIPSNHEIYDYFLSYPILVALILMSLGLSLKEVIKLPKKILFSFILGALGTSIGAIVAAILAYPSLGENAFKVSAQLCASYIGGGENAVAIKNILNVEDELFIATFAVDNVLTTVWFFVTLSYASPSIEKNNEKENSDVRSFDGAPFVLTNFLLTLSVALVILNLSIFLNPILGIHKILLMSLLSIFVGQIPSLRPYLNLSYLMGSLIFIFFFFSIGAISRLEDVSKIPTIVLAMPFVIVFIHALFMLLAKKLFKLTTLEASICSQSLIGGPATAVAVAQAKRSKEGIGIGIILGLLGYAVGTFFGVGVAYIAKFLLGVI